MTAKSQAKQWVISGFRRLTDVGDGGSNADFDARVALFSEFALEELVQFGVEDTVSNELSLLGNGSSLGGSHVCGLLWNLSSRDSGV